MDYRKVRKQEKNSKRKGPSSNTVLALAAVVSIIVASVVVISSIARHIASKNELNQPTPEPTYNAESPIISEAPAVLSETSAPVITEEPIQRRGTAVAVPEDIQNKMNGLSMHPNDDISYNDLSYLTIPHYDFNYNVCEGHMIVNAALAEEVLDIFAELYDIKYPIERMELVDEYGADDFESIEHNNTSAFNYRQSTDGTGRLSKHALGRAIDINPQINPWVNSNGQGSHSNAAEYWSRDFNSWSSEVARAAYIGPESKIYDIFVNKYGWEWGGNWSSYRDYQHFQKFN